MTDPAHRGDTDGGAGYDPDSRTGMPRWAKVTAIVVALLALLVIIVLLVGGGGGHGPSRHFSP